MIAFIKPPGTGQSRTVDELLADFRATGAQAPFEELVRRYAAMVFSECYAVTKSRHDAEDAAQATFLTLAVQARTGEEIRYLGPWLQRVARRVALDQEKAKRRRKRREDNHHRVNGSTGLATAERASVDQLELRHLINEELQELPAKYRMPLILHYFGGLSREQMAKELKCKPATLGVRLFRAREMLGKRLAKRGVIMPAAAIPIGIAAVVRESVEQHGIMAMAASASQIAEAATRVASGLTPSAGLVSSNAMALANTAANDLIVRKVKAIIAAAAIGSSALIAGGATVIQKIHNGSISIQNLFDFSGYFRSLQAPSLPQLRVDASQSWDYSSPAPETWPSGLRLVGEGSLQLATLSVPGRSSTTVGYSAPVSQNPGAVTPSEAPRVIASTASVRPDVRTVMVPTTVSSTRSDWSMPVRPGVNPVTYMAPGVSSGEGSFPMLSSGSSSGWGKYRFLFDPTLTDVGPVEPGTSKPVGTGTTGGATSTETVVIRPVPPLQGLPTSPVNSVDSAGGALTAPVMINQSSAYLSVSYHMTMDGSGTQPASQVVAGSGTGVVSAVPSTSSISSTGNVLRGWGQTDVGTLDMSGVVVADGFSRIRVLDLTSVSRLTNSVPNTPSGINGWYAQRGGALKLPAISIVQGTSTVTWGDTTENGGRLDLVNALQLTVHNAQKSGSISISLLAPDRVEIPAIPSGYDALTVWSVSGFDSIDAASLDITARYALPGSVLAGPMSGLSLFYYEDGSGWKSANASINPSQRLINANSVPVSSMWALFTVDLDDAGILQVSDVGTADAVLKRYSFASTTNMANVFSLYTKVTIPVSETEPVRANWRSISSSPSAVVPEPKGLALLCLGLPWLTRRRRS